MDASCKICSNPLTYTDYALFGDLCERCWENELGKEERKGERLVKAKL